MCNGASDGDRYSGRTEPAQVSGAHGDGEAASPHFCLCFVGCALQSKIFSYLKHRSVLHIGHNYAANGPIYTI